MAENPGNKAARARYRKKMKARGFKNRSLYLTPDERAAVEAFLRRYRDGSQES